jgi:hypothetical protein
MLQVGGIGKVPSRESRSLQSSRVDGGIYFKLHFHLTVLLHLLLLVDSLFTDFINGYGIIDSINIASLAAARGYEVAGLFF